MGGYLVIRVRRFLFRLQAALGRTLLGHGLGKLPVAALLVRWLSSGTHDIGIIRVSVGGGRHLWVDPSDRGVGRPIAVHGVWEPHITKLIQEALEPGMNVLDVGANLGYYTTLAAAAVGPTGTVWAFEPDPRNCELLRRNVLEGGYANVRVIQAAAGAARGKAEMERYAKNYGASTMVRNPNSGREVFQIETVTVDEVVGDCPIGLAKIDVEHSEMFVLQGMRKTIKANQRLAIALEFSPHAYRRLGFDPEAWLQDMQSNGFGVWRVLISGTLEPAWDPTRGWTVLGEGGPFDLWLIRPTTAAT